jgi:hypothetical protein
VVRPAAAPPPPPATAIFGMGATFRKLRPCDAGLEKYTVASRLKPKSRCRIRFYLMIGSEGWSVDIRRGKPANLFVDYIPVRGKR